jgi:hypothetical protein
MAPAAANDTVRRCGFPVPSLGSTFAAAAGLTVFGFRHSVVSAASNIQIAAHSRTIAVTTDKTLPGVSPTIRSRSTLGPLARHSPEALAADRHGKPGNSRIG